MNQKLIDNYTFRPNFDQAYVDDMNAMEDLPEGTNRIQSRESSADYSYSAPMKAIDPSLVEIHGKWKP